jgi:ankyrin repeat protein
MQLYPSALHTPGRDDWLPLHVACANARHESTSLARVQVLLTEREDIRATLRARTRSLQWTPLHCACHYRACKSVVEYVLEQDASVVLLRDVHGRLPVELAREQQSADVVELLESMTASKYYCCCCFCNDAKV